jgi:Protein of unknown function (DUF992)
MFQTWRFLCVRARESKRHAEIEFMRFSLLSLACLSLLAAPLAQAHEEIYATSPVRAGVLECQGGESVGQVVTSTTSLDCIFRSEGHRPEPYVATLHRYGVDLGVTAETRMAWAVSAPTDQFGHGELAGRYGGVAANASVGFGFGGHFLVGGPANAYVLQPIGLQGQLGVNVAAGAVDLELTPVRLVHRAGRPMRRRYR